MVEPGAGEAIHKGKKRRRLALMAALAGAGGVSGFYIGYTDAESLFDRSASWPPAVAIVLAAIYLIAIVGGSVLLSRQMDELERQNAYKAGSMAGTVYIVAYPTWFILWKGGFAPEPMHGILFILFWLALALSSLYYRFR